MTQLAQLTLVKVVDNTGGGTAEATAWTLDATGGPTPFAEGPTGVHQAVAAGSYTLSESGGPSGYAASGWVCTNREESGQTVTIGTRNVTCTITNTFVPAPAISVVKTATLHDTITAANTAGKADAGETISYSFLVTNTGNVTLTGVAVTDPKLGSAVTCNPTTLAPGANATCTPAAAYTVTSGDVAAGKPVINTATASGQPPTGEPVTATGQASVPTQQPIQGPEPVVTPPQDAPPVVAGIVEDAPVVAGIVEDAPVVAGIVEDAPAVAGTLAFTGAETVPLGLSGLLMLVLGAALTVTVRRQDGKRARE